MAYELLAQPIRKYIYDKGWESLRPIQAAAISKILSTEDNYILASRTASGKTEAAFLPILSKVDFREKGVQVLYISPLIALINDQFYRVEELCQYLDVPVTRWHGEANKTLKEKLVKEPKGIVLITPESLEAMFVNASYKVAGLFSNLKFVIIDEIHSFIGTDRGVQLKSILSRLQQVSNAVFNVVGLSATIGDYAQAKQITGREDRTKVLLDKTAKEMNTAFRYFENKGTELSVELINDLYENTRENKVLIFPNSRGRAEEVAVKLHKEAERKKGHAFYFSHHSSVDKELREHIEHFAKSNQLANFCIACTSTLELGIDIGSVDKVVQIDATHSIASLIQRVGRSGRREGEKSSLLLYATDAWSLLQSLACWSLYKEGFIEPVHAPEKPYDILLHQLLSIVKGTSGTSREALLEKIKVNFAFSKIAVGDVQTIIDHLINIDFLELIGRELIIGVEGEKVVNSRDFYTVFSSEPMFKVTHSGKGIGEIPFGLQVRKDENILLAARIWKIIDVDEKASRIEVVPARDGKKPLFFGSGGNVHPQVRERMLQLLMDDTVIAELDEHGTEALQSLRKDFSSFSINDITRERPIIFKEEVTVWYSFTGTKINRSIAFLLAAAGIEADLDEKRSSFEMKIVSKQIANAMDQVKEYLGDTDRILESALQKNPALLSFSKWGRFLPFGLQRDIIKERYFDFEGTRVYFDNFQLCNSYY